MNEYPPHGDDERRGDDQPISGDNGAEPTAPLWAPPGTPAPSAAPGYAASPAGPSGPPPTQPLSASGSMPFGAPGASSDPSARKPRRLGFAAGVVAASLIVGGGAGVAGAAIYSNQHDDNASAAAPSVVDQKAPATTTEQVAAKVLPSVVKIEVAGSQESGSGSGIILSSDGEILTNNHVVEIAGDDGTIKVDFNDGSSAEAKVLGTDPLTDTAVVKADGVSGLTPATIGKSSNLVVGQGVVAIGSPFGLDSTVTSGIVSALNRPVNVGSDAQGNATVYPAIQTDAAINPGNSGGPLVDMNGNVVGINASIRSASSSEDQAGSIGLGFAIPIDEVMPIVDQMTKGDTPTHARIGVSVSNAQATDGTNDTDGAKVEDVTKGSAADQAGLQKGDVITKVDDHQITDSDSLVATIRSYRPGDKVTVTWLHDGKEKTATITLDSDATLSKS